MGMAEMTLAVERYYPIPNKQDSVANTRCQPMSAPARYLRVANIGLRAGSLAFHFRDVTTRTHLVMGMAEMTLAVERYYPIPNKQDSVANFSAGFGA
jgi:hypothetical protein